MLPAKSLVTTSLLVVLCLGSGADAQCPLTWTSGGPQPELSGDARCSTLWDPDGAGPAPQRLVVGGSGLKGGTQPPNQRVMTWDGSVWQPLANGPGTAGAVAALTTWNGQLVAGGTFGGGGISRIAQWNGSSWQQLGGGFPVSVDELTTWNGNLVAAGFVLGSNNTATPVLQMWDGATWTALPTPPSVRIILAMVSFQGLLCVGGRTANEQFANGALDRFDGTSWSPSILATTPRPDSGQITSLGVRQFSLVLSTLYVGGGFTTIGGVAASRIASTSGGAAFAFSAVGGGLPGPCTGLHVRASGFGTAIVARVFAATPVMQLSGSTFVPMGTTGLSSLSYYDGSYHGTGSSSSAAAAYRYDGSAWVPLVGPGIAGEVRALTPSANDMILGGTFASISGVSMNGIARWDGTTFAPLGSGVPATSIEALLTLDNGDIVAGGLFRAAGGLPPQHIAQWNGTTWSSLGIGMSHQVNALCKMPDGDIVAGGQFTMAGGVPCARIALWNGTAWAPLGSGMDADVLALAVGSDGTLFAGGTFASAGGTMCSRVAQWDGTAWLPLGTGCNAEVHGLAVRQNGDVVAVGAFTNAGGVAVDQCARWNGSAWLSMGAASGDSGIARAVFALPNGDVVAGRGFHQPTSNPDAGISRWNGSTWSGLSTGLAAANLGGSVAVRALAQRADGRLIVGGTFSVASSTMSHSLASLASTCMPLTQSYGAGCSSAAGPLVIAADAPPWLGATFRTTTTGVASGSLCLGVIGFSRLSIPLASLLAQGQPGCSLLASLDVTVLLQIGAGTAHSRFTLPNDPALIRATFHQQTIPFEFSGGGALVAVRGSNALAVTIGTL
jgi:hypothetical protein